jgi:anti-sigma regulatory factor (Ser/Thr protein kinase)
MFYSDTLPKTASSAAEARRVLDRLAGEVDADVLDDARLLVSELVANAVEHVREDGQIGLRVELRDGVLRVDVLDPGAGFVPRARRPDDPKGSGWGLHFVARLADRWSADAGRFNRVWFEIDAPRVAAAGRR